jgi:hypothetical protein
MGGGEGGAEGGRAQVARLKAPVAPLGGFG